MKHVRHVLTAVATLLLALVLAVPAFAEGETGHTITVPSSDTHTYKVYQVLKGDLSQDGKTLSNAVWGADAIADHGDIDTFTASLEGKSASEVAALVAAKVDTTKTDIPTVKAGAPLTGLATGYYVLVDVTDPLADTETLALNVVKLVNDVEVNKKWDSTSDTKIIASDTLGKDEGTNEINGATDNVSVGDTVNYQITAKVPTKASDYNYFYFIINDTLSDGLTFTEGSIKVYKGSVAAGNLLVEDTDETDGDYLLKTGNDATPKTFQVALLDAKALACSDIIVTYSAVLNENAKIGEDANTNTSTVTFSNDPNHTYDGENYPGFPADKDRSVLGETPESTTKTYTTGIEIQKVDENGNVLTGATFKISGASTKKVLTVTETFTEDPNGNYYKLKNGTYTKEAPSAKETMVLTPGATAGYVVDDSYTGDDAKTVDGHTYRPYAPATDEGKDVYVLENDNSSLYESTETKYVKGTSKDIVDATSSHKAENAVDANGLVRFDGLGEGTYKIEETVTPDGYNTLPELKVEVTFNDDGTPKWSFDGGSGSYDSAEGIYKLTIVNNKGTELPETGGMGTTILYVVGGLMVATGVVMFITKRRMASIEG